MNGTFENENSDDAQEENDQEEDDQSENDQIDSDQDEGVNSGDPSDADVQKDDFSDIENDRSEEGQSGNDSSGDSVQGGSDTETEDSSSDSEYPSGDSSSNDGDGDSRQGESESDEQEEPGDDDRDTSSGNEQTDDGDQQGARQDEDTGAADWQDTEGNSTNQGSGQDSENEITDGTTDGNTNGTVDTEEVLVNGDPGADLVTVAEMEATVPFDSFTGDWSRDLLRVAESQVGFAASTRNFVVDEKDEEKTYRYYSRYGDWYGIPYAQWDAAFAAFCVRYAGIPAEDFADYGDSAAWMDALSEKGGFRKKSSGYEPKQGDLVFFKEEETGLVRMGIVCGDYVILEKNENSGDEREVRLLEIIEGDAGQLMPAEYVVPEGCTAVVRETGAPGNFLTEAEAYAYRDNTAGAQPAPGSVRIVSYLYGAQEILGYGILPTEYSEQTMEALLFTDGTLENRITDPELGIRLLGVLPDGGYCAAYPVEETPSNGARAWMAFEILLFDRAGSRVQPEHGDIKLMFYGSKVGEACAGSNGLTFYHIDPETGEQETLEAISDDVQKMAPEDDTDQDGVTKNTEGRETALSNEEKSASSGGQNSYREQENSDDQNESGNQESSDDRNGSGDQESSDDRNEPGDQESSDDQNASEGQEISEDRERSAEENTTNNRETADENSETETQTQFPVRTMYCMTDSFSVYILGDKEPVEEEEEKTDSEQNAPEWDGYIHLRNFAQLQLIGTDTQVTDTDTNPEEGMLSKGNLLTDKEGNVLQYSAGAAYWIDEDIAFPDGETWNLPEDFTGTFSGSEDADRTRLYDPETDTIYLQNRYQLAAIQSEEREDMPVVTGDVECETFGMGKLIYPNGTISEEEAGSQPEESNQDETGTADATNTETAANAETNSETETNSEAETKTETETDTGTQTETGTDTEDPADTSAGGETPSYLTYSTSHHYVLSAAFTEKTAVPRMMKAAPTRAAGSIENTDHIDGRDYFGQVTKEIDGTTYILIGDRQQLDAINEDTDATNPFDTRTAVYGPVFEVKREREDIWGGLTGLVWQGYTEWEVVSVKLVYPGDADLIDGIYDGEGNDPVNFSGQVMYDGHNGTSSTDRYHSLTSTLHVSTGKEDTVYCTVDPTTGTWNIDARTDGTLKYEKDGNYIVFRNIDMEVGALNGVNWKPLMFSGTMYGVKSANSTDVSTIWNNSGTASSMNIDTSNKPVISNINVVPVTLTQFSDTRLDLDIQTGVGFFGTITGAHRTSAFSSDRAVVRNIRLENGTVSNPAVKAEINPSLVNGLLIFTADLLGLILDPVLTLLLRKNIGVGDLLEGLLNARAKAPDSLATGAFAGRIMANALVEDCEVKNITVTTVQTSYESSGKIVGKGGFVGYVEGETQYDPVSMGLGGVVNALASLLNIIPGLGLGDLVTVLLDNALPLEKLIPIGYTTVEINRCKVIDGTLSTENGKYGVGGFAGSVCGTVISDSSVEGSSMVIHADHFGGGFAGIERDAVIQTTLGGLLEVDLGSLHPQSELIDCSIKTSDMTVNGNTYLGGFVGSMADSYGINSTIDSSSTLTVAGSGDYVGGYTGYAGLGTVFGIADYLENGESLTTTVSGLLTAILGPGGDQALLDLAGVAPSAIMGFQNDARTTVSSEGAFVGGIVGRGNGVYITSSDGIYLRKLGKYSKKRNNVYVTGLPSLNVGARPNYVSGLVSVSAGSGKSAQLYEDKSFVGGLAGYLTSANVGGLLGDTLGIGQYLGFTVCETTIQGIDNTNGYTVTAQKDYAAGGIGWAVGGDVTDTEVLSLGAVEAENHAAGFVGATGPGDLVSGEGLDLSLFGISLISIDNLLSLVSGIRTTYERANVTGVTGGFTVTETGKRTVGDQTRYLVGGYAAEANSVRIVDCHVRNLLTVEGNMNDGAAGGFVGSSAAGGLAGAVETTSTLNAVQVGQLLDAIPYLVPTYDGCSVHYVDGGSVLADTAGGFAGEFQSGKVNEYSRQNIDPRYNDDETGYIYTNVCPQGYTEGISTEPWSVYNIDHVRGGSYAGGWGGKVYSGALASAGGGLSLLSGRVSTGVLSAQDLLSAASVYVPYIRYAGVISNASEMDQEIKPKGFSVYAGTFDRDDPYTGYAGGFIGYGSGVQVSWCDVRMLKTGVVTYPDLLEGQDGSPYMSFDNEPEAIPYAVAGARYAGGYIGYMDIGSAASVGGGLSLLGNSIQLSNVLDALSVVVSTIEHSDVHGAPGGFSVIASSKINEHQGRYDERGVAYAGGYAGKISGGHIQDGNVKFYEFVIGEVAAGGYVGEQEPGDVANILDDGSLSLLGKVDGLASLMADFVPTIRNSETTAVPCGSIIRAQCFSDGTGDSGSVIRGMAGGYVGHCVGGQIWGQDNSDWKTEDSGVNGIISISEYDDELRECAAIRVRSVYGAEYAGGYCGLMEPGSTAETGGLSLLGDLLSVNNVLSTLEVAYPTIRYAAVYGPLESRPDTEWDWATWAKYVGLGGSFASDILNSSVSQEDIVYGYHVVAGRTQYDNHTNTILSGCAGGFVGAMHSGVIRKSHAEDAKLVSAMRAAGGFVGEMQTKGLADFGNVDLLGGNLNLNLGNLINIAEVFVPEISESGTTGYQQGLTVMVNGDKENNGVGMAGGFAGAGYGAQLGLHNEEHVLHDPGDEKVTTPSVWVQKLKNVFGTGSIGGFIGKTSSASVLSADTEDLSNSFLQRLLNNVISTPSDLIDVLDATICTIKYAEVDASDPKWGIVINGEYKRDGGTEYADFAGGFAGSLEASVLGQRQNADDTLVVNHLRGVLGGYYAGGFFGLADVGSVAEVGGSSGTGDTTTILNLIEAGNISALDAFRTYIYHAGVTGTDDGIRIYANKDSHRGTMSSYEVIGAAGGFGGGLMNGTVEHSYVKGLNYVEAPYFSAGFIGHMGRNGGVTVDEAKVTNDSVLGIILSTLGLNLDTQAQLLNIVGATVTGCEAEGYDAGFITRAVKSQVPISGLVAQEDLTGSCSAGFTGFADISQMDDCHVTNYKYAVSPQIAGGFIGRSSTAYIVDVDVSSGLTGLVVQIVNLLIKALYLDHVEQIDLIDIGGQNAALKVLSDGDVLFVNLFGLKIGVSLIKNDPEYDGGDAAVITIGSSTIKVPCDEDGIKGETPDVSVNLFEGNRTAVRNSSVTGIPVGYDVLGGGADYEREGSDHKLGYAGGFIGYNDNGFLSHNTMWLCDIVRGSMGEGNFSGTPLAGPFTGGSIASSRDLGYLEGTDNKYYIYRSAGYNRAQTAGILPGTTGTIGTAQGADPEDYWNDICYETTHRNVITSLTDLTNAVETEQNGSGEEGIAATRDLKAYTPQIYNPQADASDPDSKAWPATAWLMQRTKQNENSPGDTPLPDELKDPCDNEFNLVINKIWNDLNDMFRGRPDEITVYVTQIDIGTENTGDDLIQCRTPAEGDVITGNRKIVLNRAEDSNESFTTAWKRIIEGLPIAYKVETAVPEDEQTGETGDGGNDGQSGENTPSVTEEIHYYRYLVYEVEVSGYTNSYDVDQTTASVFITNKYNSWLMPYLGGPASILMIVLLILAGLMLLFCGKRVISGYKRKGV